MAANSNNPADQLATGLERWLTRVCKIVAAAGGIVLLAITVLTVISVAGRSLFNTPVPGDFELVELGCAIAIFAFLPYCQIRKGNVIVDFFTAGASPATTNLLSAIGDLLFMLIAGLITWRMVFGALDFFEYTEQTMVLRVPLWWAFVAILPASALLTVTCAYTAWRHLQGVRE